MWSCSGKHRIAQHGCFHQAQSAQQTGDHSQQSRKSNTGASICSPRGLQQVLVFQVTQTLQPHFSETRQVQVTGTSINIRTLKEISSNSRDVWIPIRVHGSLASVWSSSSSFLTSSMELQQHVMSHGAGKREGHRLLLPSVYPRLHTHFTRCSRLLTSACPFGPRGHVSEDGVRVVRTWGGCWERSKGFECRGGWGC